MDTQIIDGMTTFASWKMQTIGCGIPGWIQNVVRK